MSDIKDATIASRLEDLTWMAETGESLTGAAQRLGLKPGSLETWARRNAPTLLRRLIAQEPRDHNANPGNQYAHAS